MEQQITRESITQFLKDCLRISGVGTADNMSIEYVSEGVFAAKTPDGRQKFIVTVQEIPESAAEAKPDAAAVAVQV